MAFEDEARAIGLDFLDLIPGNLRETSQYIHNKYNMSVPSYSYAKLWGSLVGQLGIVDTVRKILQDFVENLSPDTEELMRKAVRQPLTEKEYEAIDRFWFLIDDKTLKISRLGLFVLNYGTEQFKELGRLSSVRVYHISRCIHSLLQARPRDEVVFPDGSIEKHSDCLLLGYLRNLEHLLGQYGLAVNEYDRLCGIIDTFTNRYNQNDSHLDEEDHRRLIRVIDRIETAVNLEIVQRDFAELRPASGILDYQKTPLEVLRGLLGEESHSLSQVVRRDLEEGIKCLRFGAPTASVILSLRAVEGRLRELYQTLTGRKTKKGWFALIKDIQQALSAKRASIDPAMGFLNYLRSVRNTADHPDAIFDQAAAEQTLMHTTSAIRELQKLSEAAPSGS